MKTIASLFSLLIANSIYASQLDIQTGQWSAEVHRINFSGSSFSNTYSYENGDKATWGQVEGDFTVRGRYAISNPITIRLHSSIGLERDFEQGPGSNEREWTSEKNTYSISPSLEINATKNIAFLLGTSLTSLSEGDSEYANSRMQIFGGPFYSKDIHPKLLFTSETGAIRELYKWAPNGWDDQVNSISYLRLYTTNKLNYFLANNFSVNLGLNLSGGWRTGRSIDGEKVEDDSSWSYRNLGSTFGFTYYHR